MDDALARFTTVLKFCTKRPTVVHKNPTGFYQHFVNAYVFVNEHIKRSDAVRQAQREWRISKPANATLVAITEATFTNAEKKMKKVTGGMGTILQFMRKKVHILYYWRNFVDKICCDQCQW